MSGELEIPEAAYDALHKWTDGHDAHADPTIRAIAGPVVVAAFRRLGSEFGEEYTRRELKRQQWEAEQGRRDYTSQHFASAVGQAAQALYDHADEIERGLS